MKNDLQLTVGTDPEFFIMQNGEIIPPVELEYNYNLNAIETILNEAGEHKHSIYLNKNNIKVMSDGAALELTVPYSRLENYQELIDTVHEGYKLGSSLVKKFDMDVSVIPVGKFNTDIYNPSRGEKFWNACVFGCDPDENCHKLFSPDIDVSKHKLRYGGGHIHVGSELSEIKDLIHEYPFGVIKLMDIFVGNFVFSHSENIELEKERMKFYGKPGTFRIQEHGIEYRTPSNNWTVNTKENQAFLFEELIKLTVELIHKDVNKAVEIVNKYEQETLESFKNITPQESKNILYTALGEIS